MKECRCTGQKFDSMTAPRGRWRASLPEVSERRTPGGSWFAPSGRRGRALPRHVRRARGPPGRLSSASENARRLAPLVTVRRTFLMTRGKRPCQECAERQWGRSGAVIGNHGALHLLPLRIGDIKSFQASRSIPFLYILQAAMNQRGSGVCVLTTHWHLFLQQSRRRMSRSAMWACN